MCGCQYGPRQQPPSRCCLPRRLAPTQPVRTASWAALHQCCLHTLLPHKPQAILNTLHTERGSCCLEHLRLEPDETIQQQLSRFKGVGPKTIACVLLFCMEVGEACIPAAPASPPRCWWARAQRWHHASPLLCEGTLTLALRVASTPLCPASSQSGLPLACYSAQGHCSPHTCTPSCLHTFMPVHRHACTPAQRTHFPVDTHVWEISKQLAWVPATATREQAYDHLNCLLPDELKCAREQRGSSLLGRCGCMRAARSSYRKELDSCSWSYSGQPA